MTIRTALIICPEGDNAWISDRRLLGLTVGERLLLALETIGVDRIAFVGTGPRPASSRVNVETVLPEECEFSNEESAFVLLTSDLIFDRKLLESPEEMPGDLPVRCLPVSEWSAVASAADEWIERLGSGAAGFGKGFAVRVGDRESGLAAKKALLLSLYKDQDGIISRHLNRKISTWISQRLANTSIRPNQFTLMVFLVGICSGPLAFIGTHLGFAAGAFCYWFSAVLDGCDGEIARLKYLGSPLGAWLDTVVDDMVCLSYVVGMYLALARESDHPYWLFIGAGGVTFFLLTILPRYYIMAARLGSGDYQKLAKGTRPRSDNAISRFFLAVRDVIFRTDFLPFYALVTAAAGFVPAFAVPFAIGSIASAVDTFVTLATYKPQSNR